MTNGKENTHISVYSSKKWHFSSVSVNGIDNQFSIFSSFRSVSKRDNFSALNTHCKWKYLINTARVKCKIGRWSRMVLTNDMRDTLYSYGVYTVEWKRENDRMHTSIWPYGLYWLVFHDFVYIRVFVFVCVGTIYLSSTQKTTRTITIHHPMLSIDLSAYATRYFVSISTWNWKVKVEIH